MSISDDPDDYGFSDEEKAAIERAIEVSKNADEATYQQRARDLIQEHGDGVAMYLEVSIELARQNRHYDVSQDLFLLRNSVAMALRGGNGTVQ